MPAECGKLQGKVNIAMEKVGKIDFYGELYFNIRKYTLYKSYTYKKTNQDL